MVPIAIQFCLPSQSWKQSTTLLVAVYGVLVQRIVGSRWNSILNMILGGDPKVHGRQWPYKLCIPPNIKATFSIANGGLCVFGQTFPGVKVGLIYTYEAKRGSKKIWSPMARKQFALHPNVGIGPHHCCWWLWHLWGQSGFSIKCLPSRRPKNI